MTYKARVYISYSILERHFVLEDTVQVSIAYSAGVLLGRVNVTSSRSFKRPATFDFELEGTVEGRGPGKVREPPLPSPLIRFDRLSPPWYKLLFFPCLLAKVSIIDELTKAYAIVLGGFMGNSSFLCLIKFLLLPIFLSQGV